MGNPICKHGQVHGERSAQAKSCSGLLAKSARTVCIFGSFLVCQPFLQTCFTQGVKPPTQRWRLCSAEALPEFVPLEKVSEITEAEALYAMRTMHSVSLELPASVAQGSVDVTYLQSVAAPNSAKPPLLLVHGFDISCLEFRRLLPHLEAAGLEAHAVCIAGWGFTDTANMTSIGIQGKRAQLLAFWEQVMQSRPMVLIGASLGASIAADLIAERPDAVKSLVMLDTGMFTPPPPVVPKFVAQFLIRYVLGNPGVREFIAKQAFFDKSRQTEDAIRIGQLHVLRPKWEEDSIEWLLSGGYSIDGLLPKLNKMPLLALWGREDEVIPPSDGVPQLLASLPWTSFRWIESSGHTPHLEQPEATAAAIVAFIEDRPVPGDSDVSSVLPAAESPLDKLLNGRF
eukprot:TRINITY_DN26611_c0_g1_i1.p1 TRINITY_DN26611_c0_g1~~TRINITY_DN26611_c0_g1_i1.p1  ORF type:complete len:399 (+),score=73.12 TRINITY_DN26611_c0_g1_i1:258-1454(+)